MEYRRIYLMPDYGSDSLWTDEPSHFGISAELLPLKQETATALAAWSQRLFEFLEHDEDDDWLAAHKPSHDAEGLRLWNTVRDELGPDYEVGLAVFEDDPDRPGRSRRRIVWDPADLQP